jgi:hypothetical protein
VEGVEAIRVVGQLEGEFELKGKRECLTVLAFIGSKEPQGWFMPHTVGSKSGENRWPQYTRSTVCRIGHTIFLALKSITDTEKFDVSLASLSPTLRAALIEW